MNAPAEFATFSFHGVDLSTINNTGQAVTDCPFCFKDKHFFVSAKKDNAGQFHCKHCDLKGNRYTFLQLFYERRLSETKDSHYKTLAKWRETRYWTAFKEDQWAWDGDRKVWLIPVYNSEGSVVNLQVYCGPKADVKYQNTAGCAMHLYGGEQIIKDGPIVICEGFPDATMLRHVWPMVDERPVSILGSPGKDQFSSCAKKLKGNPFANRDVILMYDSGAHEAQENHAKILLREYHARSVLCLNWPESFPSNYDITDLFNAKGHEDGYAKIRSFLRPCGAKSIAISPTKKFTLETIIREFRETGVHVNKDFSDAITVTFASIASIGYGGIPLWLYLVGPPGSGKSLILESTIMSPICHYQTDLKYTTMVSGYQTDPDPSLLAKIMDRVLVIKDYTTIMDKNEVTQKELLGLLRDAYDGQVVKEYGNGIIRIYPDPSTGRDRCYFGMVCGVTQKIHVYNKAALGERFLKCSIGRSGISAKDIVRRAIEGSDKPWLEVEKANRRQQAVGMFFEQVQASMGQEPPSIKKYADSLIALAQFTAVARTRPERDLKSEDLLYEAEPESATRLGKQFTKLAGSLAAIKGLDAVDDECMRLVRKVAWETSHGWHRTVYETLWTIGTKKPTTEEIRKTAGLSSTTTARVLKDLRDLEIATKIGRTKPTSNGGRPADQWQLTKHGREIAAESRIFA